MRTRLGICLLASVVAVVSAQTPDQNPPLQRPTFRGGINYVKVDMYASTRDGKPILDLQRDEIEWMTSMTYQAASGAGAANMRELVAQMAQVGDSAKALLDDPASAIYNLPGIWRLKGPLDLVKRERPRAKGGSTNDGSTPCLRPGTTHETEPGPPHMGSSLSSSRVRH